MKHITNEQMPLIKSWVIEALGEKGMNFNSYWIAQLKTDLASDQDRACNAIELANYISWHMQYHAIQYGIQARDDHANFCAYKAVLFALNEYMGE